MKQFIVDAAKKYLPESSQQIVRDVFRRSSIHKLERDLMIMRQNVAALTADRLKLKRDRQDINDYGFQVSSQHGEDGLLLYIFSVIGTTDRKFLEFGIEDGRECNTANLSINWDWSGVVIEANSDEAKSADEYFTKLAPGRVNVINSFVTVENINSLISDGGLSGSVDLLSVDIDSNDYWVWKAITAIQPRVCVVEYNARLGAHDDITIEHVPDLSWNTYTDAYYGASLAAMTRLGASKGYSLIGCDVSGVNAFFVRNDCLGSFKALSAAVAWRPLYPYDFDFDQAARTKDGRPWVDNPPV